MADNKSSVDANQGNTKIPLGSLTVVHGSVIDGDKCHHYNDHPETPGLPYGYLNDGFHDNGSSIK